MLNTATAYNLTTLVSYSELNERHAGEGFTSLRHKGTFAAMSV